MDPDVRPVDLEDGEALDEFVAEHDVALVEFNTAGCSMCGAMEPVLGNVARASDVAVGLVNPGDDLSLVERFDVRSVPTLVPFRDGEAVARKAEGFQGAAVVVEFLETHAPEMVDPSGPSG